MRLRLVSVAQLKRKQNVFKVKEIKGLHMQGISLKCVSLVISGCSTAVSWIKIYLDFCNTKNNVTNLEKM